MSRYRIAMARALWTRGMSIAEIAARLGIDAGAVENLIEDPQTPGAEPGKEA